MAFFFVAFLAAFFAVFFTAFLAVAFFLVAFLAVFFAAAFLVAFLAAAFLVVFFAAAFLVAFFAAFLVAYFIDRFSLDIRFAASRRPQCDSYIRLFERNVKEKMTTGRAVERTARSARVETFASTIVVEHFQPFMERAMACETDRRVPAPKRMAALACLILIAAGAGCRKRPARVPTPPAVVPPGEEIGIASWYGHPYHGRRTASGEVYDMEQYTAAHRTRPFGSWVRVHNLENGKWVDVRINDRGPFVDGRIIDLSRAAARAIGMLGAGTARVRLETIAPPEPTGSGGKEARYGVQVGAFRRRENAERLARRMERRYGTVAIRYRDGDPPVWRVIVGSWKDEHKARRAAGRMKGEGGRPFVVRLDPDAVPAT